MNGMIFPEKAATVFIRPLSVNDEKEFLRKVLRSKEVFRHWVSPPQTSVEFRKRVNRARLPSYKSFVVCHHETLEIIGLININEIVKGAFESGYLGYYRFADFNGKGFMTEGLKLVVEHAFSHIKLHRLEANIQPDNQPSIALVKRCGFKLEGFSPKYLKIRGKWRDHERWAILDV